MNRIASRVPARYLTALGAILLIVVETAPKIRF